MGERRRAINKQYLKTGVIRKQNTNGNKSKEFFEDVRDGYCFRNFAIVRIFDRAESKCKKASLYLSTWHSIIFVKKIFT